MNRVFLCIAFCCYWVIADAHLDWVDSIINRKFDQSAFTFQKIILLSQNPIIEIEYKNLEFNSETEFLRKVNVHLQEAAKTSIDQFMIDVLERDKQFELVEEFCLDNVMRTETIPIYCSDFYISLLRSTYYYFANGAHGSERYHGFNFFSLKDSSIELTYETLSNPNKDLRGFVTKYCEDILIGSKIGYFADDGFKNELEQNDVDTFIITDCSLVIIFQPYTVEGLMDFPFSIKIDLDQIKPYLRDEWQTALFKKSA